jgi:hypothetical protein
MEFAAELYLAYRVEGWGTEELLAQEAEPSEVALAKAWAEAHGEPWPPVPTDPDLASQIIRAAFEL